MNAPCSGVCLVWHLEDNGIRLLRVVSLALQAEGGL